MAVVGGVPVAKPEPGKPGQVDKLMIARAQKGASAVLQKINQARPGHYHTLLPELVPSLCVGSYASPALHLWACFGLEVALLAGWPTLTSLCGWQDLVTKGLVGPGQGLTLTGPGAEFDGVSREVTINDAAPNLRHHLTKRSTQDDISKRTKAAIVVRGRYMPAGVLDATEKPLFLKCTPGLSLTEVGDVLCPSSYLDSWPAYAWRQPSACLTNFHAQQCCVSCNSHARYLPAARTVHLRQEVQYVDNPTHVPAYSHPAGLQSAELQQYSVDCAAAEIEAVLKGGQHRLGNPPLVLPAPSTASAQASILPSRTSYPLV